MINWKKATGILLTVGVTATVIYVSYSFVFLASKKDFLKLKENLIENDFFKNLSSLDEEKMILKIHNISKKELIKFSELLIKEKPLSNEDQISFDKIIKKWGYNIETKKVKK